jgi:hypothetical protein
MQTSSFARYFSGEARIWPRNFSRLWKAYHLLPPAAAVRIVELATSHLWRWDSASISARTLILSAGDVSKQHKSAGVDATNNFGACSLRLLDSLFAVDAEFRKKSNALEALAALGRSIPLPNGDGPYQSLLRRYYGEKELVASVVRFASSRPAKHIGGEIVNRTIADYECAHNSIINNVNVLSAVRAAAKSEDVDLLRAGARASRSKMRE